MATTGAQAEKRKAIDAEHPAPPSSHPKRARFSACINLRDDDGTARGGPRQDQDSNEDKEGGSARASSPLSAHTSCTEQSVAETSFTSTSVSKRRPKRYQCGYEGCGKAFDRPVRLTMHIRSHTNERPYVCEEEGCDKTFLRSEHLKRHQKDKHSEERSYVCTYGVGTTDEGATVECGRSFTTATRLKRHEAVHEAREETKCHEPGCGKVFRKQETLQRHIKLDHLHEKAFKCTHVTLSMDNQATECLQVFARPEQLKNHQAREHSGVRYFCDVCSSAPDLDHGNSNSKINHDTIVESALCASESSRVGFLTYNDLQQHLKAAHPPTCSDCGKQCHTNRALKAHIDIEHSTLSERQQFGCNWPGCNRAFTKSGNLKVHVQNVHARARNFVCGTFELIDNPKVEGWNGHGCGNAFGTKANLEDHVRTQHLGLPGKIRPSVLRKRALNSGSATPSTLDPDDITTPGQEYVAMSMLTGVGYEKRRHIGCLVDDCQVRFSKEYDLASHLELTHGWQVEDVNDRLAERCALEGGPFWFGGAGQENEEKTLPCRLDDVLSEANLDNLYGPADADVAQQPEDNEGIQRQSDEKSIMKEEIREKTNINPVTVNGMMSGDGVVMAIDPELARL